MKIAVSIVLLFGLLASEPALAKQAHAQHAGASPARVTNAANAKPAETIDADVTVLTPRGGFTPVTRNANTSQKPVKPEIFTHRPVVNAPISPVIRNAIGQPVQSKSVRVEAPRVAPAVQAPGTVPRASTRSLVTAPLVAPSNVGRTTFHPAATAAISGQGRIDGARLIRPSAAPLGVGGPSHAVNGISGTTVRIKR